MNESVKDYCQETGSLGKSLLKCLSFKCKIQEDWCENCNPTKAEDFSFIQNIQMSEIDIEAIRLELEIIILKRKKADLFSFQ